MRYSFITRLGAASKESYHEDTYPNLLHRYLKFDDEMSVISVVWRDSHQLIEQYNEEQVSSYWKQRERERERWESGKTTEYTLFLFFPLLVLFKFGFLTKCLLYMCIIIFLIFWTKSIYSSCLSCLNLLKAVICWLHVMKCIYKYFYAGVWCTYINQSGNWCTLFW